MENSKNIMLTVTEKCNLNCVYCFENNKRGKTMSLETAKMIIDKEMNMDDGYSKVLFDFMGGEPFMEFDLIKEICEYVWRHKWPKECSFFASTNGTLIHGDIKDWLEQHKDRFVCGISLDGIPEVQNKNRSESDSKIEKQFFVQTWPKQEAKMTVYPETVSSLFENVVYLHGLGFNVTSNLAYGADWGKEGIKEALVCQLEKLIEYYEKNKSVKPTTMVDMDIRPVAYKNEKLIKWCGMGVQMVAYDTEGTLYPCHFFQGMTVGQHQYSNMERKDFTNIQEELSEDCQKCILRNSCPTCYAYNYTSTGKYGSKDQNMCELKKIMAVATSKRIFSQISEKYIDKTEINNLEDREYIRAIHIIQRAVRTNNWSI